MPWWLRAKQKRLPCILGYPPRRCIESWRPTIGRRPTALETPGRGGRRHQYLTLPEEKDFLAPFFAQAESGEIAIVAQIQRVYEARVEHEVDESTIYRLLKRHGWRKLMPRSRHPQADPQEQEQFKKTLKPRFRRSSQPGPPKMNAQS